MIATVNGHARQVYTAVVAHVTDGDTLWVRPDAGGKSTKLRLNGIDAPEMCQEGGEASRQALVRLALNQRVLVRIRRYDNYGRGLARIERDGVDLGAQMVREGQAWSYRWHQDPGPYVREEGMAREQKLGVFAKTWREHPRDFRRRHGPCP